MSIQSSVRVSQLSGHCVCGSMDFPFPDEGIQQP